MRILAHTHTLPHLPHASISTANDISQCSLKLGNRSKEYSCSLYEREREGGWEEETDEVESRARRADAVN